LPEGKAAGWGCGDTIECCRVDNSKNCVTVTINDSGGQQEGLIDFGCAYVIGKSFFPSKTTVKVTCKKTGHKTIERKCWKHDDCGNPCKRGVNCGGKLK